MKIHCVRHEPFEGLASIEDWITTNNGHLTYTYTYMNQQFPEEIDFDLLIIMGGTASTYDESAHSWLPEEKEFIGKALKKNKKIIGICLGAQLLANVLGAKIYPGKKKEIGWFPIQMNSDILEEFPFLPAEKEVFHWHGDTFDLPPDSIRLASSEATINQGFIYNKCVWGLQFHLEMTEKSLQSIVRGASIHLSSPEEYVQSAEYILSQTSSMSSNQELIYKILDYLKNNCE